MNVHCRPGEYHCKWLYPHLPPPYVQRQFPVELTPYKKIPMQLSHTTYIKLYIYISVQCLFVHIMVYSRKPTVNLTERFLPITVLRLRPKLYTFYTFTLVRFRTQKTNCRVPKNWIHPQTSPVIPGKANIMRLFSLERRGAG